MIVDLTRLCYLGVCGARAVRDAHLVAGARHIRLTVIVDDPFLQRLFAVVDPKRLIPQRSDQAEVLRDLL